MIIKFFNIDHPCSITWDIDVNNIKINDIITIKNEKQKVNGYTELLSDLIIGELANHSRNLLEFPDFQKFVDKINLPYTKHVKVTKKYFNSIPYFKFKIIDINNDILVLDPVSIDINY